MLVSPCFPLVSPMFLPTRTRIFVYNLADFAPFTTVLCVRMQINVPLLSHPKVPHLGPNNAPFWPCFLSWGWHSPFLWVLIPHRCSSINRYCVKPHARFSRQWYFLSLFFLTTVVWDNRTFTLTIYGPYVGTQEVNKYLIIEACNMHSRCCLY